MTPDDEVVPIENFDSVQVIKHSYDDIDAYTDSLKGWSLDVNPLRGGVVKVDMANLTTRRISFRRFSHRLPSVHRGLSDDKGLALVYYPADYGPLLVNHRVYERDVVLIHPPKADISLISPNHFAGYSLTLSHEFLQGVGEVDMLYRTASQILPESTFSQARLKMALRQLAQLLEWVCLAPQEHLRRLLLAEDICLLQVLPALRQLTMEHEGMADVPALHESLSAVLDLIMNNLDAPPALSEMAVATGFSGRYIQMLFRRFLGVSPKEFIKLMRLHDARRRLLSTSWPSKGVTDVAISLGFNHFGRFSQDYKQRYGETPLQTLRRDSYSGGV